MATKAVKKSAKKNEVVDRSEIKKKKFLKVAGMRVVKVVKAISLIGNCGNKNVYGYTDKQVEEMFAAMQNELNDARKAFNAKAKESKAAFVFSAAE